MPDQGRKLKAGDQVEWNTSQGKTRGVVTRKVTGAAKAGGHTAHAHAVGSGVRGEERKERQDRHPSPGRLEEAPHGILRMSKVTGFVHCHLAQRRASRHAASASTP